MCGQKIDNREWRFVYINLILVHNDMGISRMRPLMDPSITFKIRQPVG